MGRWSANHWKTATFGWLALVVVAFGIGGMVGTKNPNPNTVRPGRVGPDGPDPRRRLQAAAPRRACSSRARPPRPARPRSTRSCRTPPPASREGAGRPAASSRRRSRRTGTPCSSTSRSPAREDKAPDKVRPVVDAVAAAQAAHPGFFIGEMGDASAQKAVMDQYGKDLGKAGMLSLPITLIILLVTFGALVAAGIPLLLALTAVFATFGLVAIPSHVLPMPNEVPALVLLIGLAVGVDYTMFYLRREREERAKGRSERAALEAAAATSGRSVLISGLTVMVAMAGMLVTGDKTFAAFGVATMMVVAVAMLGSLTVLPALLSRLGDGVDRGRVPPAAAERRRGPHVGLDRRPRPAAPGAVRGDRRRAAPAPRAARDPDADGGGLAGHLPGAPRGDQDLQAHAGGVPGHGAARERDRQGAERERPGRPRRRSPSSSSGRSRAAARTSRSRSTSTRPARSRTSRSRSTATARTRRRTSR